MPVTMTIATALARCLPKELLVRRGREFLAFLLINYIACFQPITIDWPANCFLVRERTSGRQNVSEARSQQQREETNEDTKQCAVFADLSRRRAGLRCELRRGSIFASAGVSPSTPSFAMHMTRRCIPARRSHHLACAWRSVDVRTQLADTSKVRVKSLKSAANRLRRHTQGDFPMSEILQILYLARHGDMACTVSGLHQCGARNVLCVWQSPNGLFGCGVYRRAFCLLLSQGLFAVRSDPPNEQRTGVTHHSFRRSSHARIP